MKLYISIVVAVAMAAFALPAEALTLEPVSGNDAPDVDLCAAHSATEIAENAPVSVQLAKAVMNGDEATPEALAGAIAAGTEDGREGIAAFRDKRPPRFAGR